MRGALSAMRDPFPVLRQAAAIGDVVRLRRIYLVNHPDHVQRLLVDNSDNYRKTFLHRRLRPLVGDGLVTSDGATWARHRRLAQPAFHHERLATYPALMARHAAAMLDRWEPAAASGQPVDVSAELMRLTLAIVGQALFGTDLLGRADDVGAAVTTALRITNQRVWALVNLPPWVPTPANLRFRRARRVLDAVVSGIIAGRRGGEPRPDLLGMLMQARDADTGSGLDDQELRDEVMTLVLTGHESTANALAWAFHCLALAPDHDRRLHQEAQQVLGSRPAALADLPRLAQAGRVHQEALRLHPPVWMIAREAIAADWFGAHEVPAGATVSVCPWLLHRDPRFWTDPERFDPDRFLPEASAGRPRLAHVPFAAGPRMCIGHAFATMEVQVVLSMVAARYRLEAVAERPVEIEPSVTLRPRNGLWMRVVPRPGRPAALSG